MQKDGPALADADQPAMVLLDIGLPGMNGLGALRHFRERMDMPNTFCWLREETKGDSRRPRCIITMCGAGYEPAVGEARC